MLWDQLAKHTKTNIPVRKRAQQN